jgi:glycosyltransferase involved in cell wall biosynthesis
LKGLNTPMKIYSYMASGKPIVATRIGSHTQVLDESCAMLVEPEPAAMAAGLCALLADPAAGRRLGDAARALAAREYSREAYRRKLAAAYAALTPREP